MFRSVLQGAAWGLVLLVVLGVGLQAGAEEEAQPAPSVSGKKQAYMGDPTIHRGMELGWDRGYLAAKTDQQEGLSPDLGRHALYHDPQPMYRYEFGRRSYFYSGFRTGFWIGYRQGWDKVAVKYVAPHPGHPEVEAAGMESEIMIPGAGSVPAHLDKPGKPPSPQAQSDAL